MGVFVDRVPTAPFTFGTEVYSGTGSEDAKSLVTAKFNNSLENSELMLTKLLGADGAGGYLGELNTLLSGPLTWAEVSPDNSVFPTLLARLLNDLSAGATGLDAMVEAEIIARAQARQDMFDPEQVAYALAYQRGVNHLSQHFGIGSKKATRVRDFAAVVMEKLSGFGFAVVQNTPSPSSTPLLGAGQGG